MKNDTSWGGVADWYDNHLETDKDSYQEKVIAPNLLRLLDIKKGMRVLDLACGQGFFSRKFSDKGAAVTGADIGKELIELAKKRSPKIPFFATPAHKLGFAQGETFDAVVIVLAIQNISNMGDVFKEAWRVLAPKGRMILVMNHPAFRIPKRSAWGFSSADKKQYRRIDGYLSASTVPIIMHPGQDKSESSQWHVSKSGSHTKNHRLVRDKKPKTRHEKKFHYSSCSKQLKIN
jgi:ubiquinone/menaquinone biosynthesis C-methylase UbiE